MYKKWSAVLLLMFFMLLSARFVSAGTEPFIGEISVFSGNFAPRGWAFCEGQILPINQNQALYSLLGTRFGGDGRTNFALPNLKKAEESLGGARYMIALQGIYPPRQ